MARGRPASMQYKLHDVLEMAAPALTRKIHDASRSGAVAQRYFGVIHIWRRSHQPRPLRVLESMTPTLWAHLCVVSGLMLLIIQLIAICIVTSSWLLRQYHGKTRMGVGCKRQWSCSRVLPFHFRSKKWQIQRYSDRLSSRA